MLAFVTDTARPEVEGNLGKRKLQDLFTAMIGHMIEFWYAREGGGEVE